MYKQKKFILCQIDIIKKRIQKIRKYIAIKVSKTERQLAIVNKSLSVIAGNPTVVRNINGNSFNQTFKLR